MLCAPPVDSTPEVKLRWLVTMAAVNAVIWAGVSVPPLHTKVGVPLIEAVKVLPISRSLTGSVPLIGARSWAEALASSATEAGWVIAASVGAFVTTDQLGYAENTVDATFNNNLFTGNVNGIEVQATNGKTANVAGTCNTLVRNSGAGINSDPVVGIGTVNNIALKSGNIFKNGFGARNQTSNPINTQSNWWGCSGGPGTQGCDTVVGAVNFVPALAQPSPCALPQEKDNNGNNYNEDNHDNGR